MSHVSGIALPSITAPIRHALMGYQSWSEHRVKFDLDNASTLELTPDKPNAARSATTVRYLGEAIATLYVIAFQPGDGTGDENAYKLAYLDTGEYPRDPKVVPRPKIAIHTEAHLTLASFAVDQPNADPLLYAGNQTVIGTSSNKLVHIGEVGQSRAFFKESMGERQKVLPKATLTTGYRDNERFGDPHAIYNDHPEFMQICGFIALKREDATPARLEMFQYL